MSEASTADITPIAAPAATALTGEGAAAPENQGGSEQQSSEAGQGAAAAEGQGAGSEQAAEGGASAEGEGAQSGEGEASQGAPEAYADFTLPEGVELTSDMLAGVTTLAKAHNLNQEQAQALVDLGAQQAQAIITQFTEQASQTPVLLAAHWAGEWSKQTAADTELGGDKLKATMATATRVFSTFATPAFGKFLDETGLAHHPELIRFMSKVGAAVSEDTLVTPQGGAERRTPGRDPAKVLYPNMN